MECPNCEFNNTPGTKTCVRCASRLDLGDVDVVPPRAGSGFALRAARYRAGGLLHRVSEAGAAAADRLRRAVHPDVDWSAVLWTVVPGAGHVHSGSRTTGLLIFVSWCALLLLTLLFIGGRIAWLLGAGVLGFHCLVFSLILAQPLATMPTGQRLATGVIVYLLLLGGLYGPALLAARATFTVVPVTGIATNPTFANGEVLLGTGRWRRPESWQRGDLVFYRIRREQTWADGNVLIQSGYGVDRILGVEGDRVRFDGETLTVNGAELPPDLMPIGHLERTPALDLHCYEGEVIVLPTALAWGLHGEAMQGAVNRMFRIVSRVPEERILSRVGWRVRPWRRFGPVH